MGVWTGTHVDIPPEAIQLAVDFFGGPSRPEPRAGQGACRAASYRLYQRLSPDGRRSRRARRPRRRPRRSTGSAREAEAAEQQCEQQERAARAHFSSSVVAFGVPVGVSETFVTRTRRVARLRPAVRSARADHRRPDRVRAPLRRRCATRSRVRSGRCARAGHGRRADELGGRVGPAPARVGELGPVSAVGRGVVGVTFLTVVPAGGAARPRPSSRRPAGGRCPRRSSRRRSGARSRRDAGLFAPVARASRDRGSARRRAPRALRPRRRAQLDVLAAQRQRRTCEVVRMHRSTKSLLAARVARRARPHARSRPTSSAPGTPLVARARHDRRASCRSVGARPRPGCCARSPSTTELEIIVGTHRRRGGRRAGASRACAGSASRSTRPRRGIDRSLGTEVWNASDPDDEVRVDRARRRRRDARRACRSNAWRCCTAPTSRTRGCCTNTSSSPTSRTTARRRARCPTRCSGAGLLRILALADTDFARDDVCGLFAAAPVLDGRGRPVPAARGSGCRATREWCGGSTNGSTPPRRVRGELGRRRARRRGSGPRPRRSAAFVADARRRSRSAALAAHVERAGPVRARARAPLPRRRGAARVVAAVRAGSGAAGRGRARPARHPRRGRSRPDPRGVPAHARARARRGARPRRPARRGRARRPGRDGARRRARPPVGVRARRRPVPGAVPRRSAARPTATAPRSAASCALRSDRTADDQRALLAALASHRRTRACAPIRAATCGAAPSTCRRGSCSTDDRRRSGDDRGAESRRSRTGHARRVPANRHELEVRAALGGEAVGRGGARGRARARAHAAPGAGSRVHPLRRQPHAPRRPAARRSARPRPNVSTSATRSGDVGEVPARVLHAARAARRAGRAARGHHAALADRARQRSCTRCSTGSSPRCATRPGVGRPWTDDRPAPAARDRGGGERATSKRGAHRPPAVVAPRPPPDPRRARRVPRRRRRSTASNGIAETLATELAFGMPEAARGAVEVPLGDGRVVRVRGKADRVDRRADGDLVVIDYKSGSERAYKALDHDDPVSAGTHAPAPGLRVRGARRVRRARPPTGRGVLLVRAAGARTAASATTSTPRSTTCSPTRVRTIVDGIEAGCSRAARRARPSPFIECDYCDPDGMGTTDRWREWERKLDAPELADSAASPASRESATGPT